MGYTSHIMLWAARFFFYVQDIVQILPFIYNLKRMGLFHTRKKPILSFLLIQLFGATARFSFYTCFLKVIMNAPLIWLDVAM